MLACRRCLVQLLTHTCRTCTIVDLSKCLMSLLCFYLCNFYFFLGVEVGVFVSLVLFLDCDFFCTIASRLVFHLYFMYKVHWKKTKHITWIYICMNSGGNWNLFESSLYIEMTIFESLKESLNSDGQSTIPPIDQQNEQSPPHLKTS